VKSENRTNLRARLKEEAIVNTERDLTMAAEWSPLEEEVWSSAKTSRSGRPRVTGKNAQNTVSGGDAASR